MTALEGQHSEPEWTKKDLMNLCASLKDSIPKNKTHRVYQLGMKDVDWEKVAFPPYSAEECKKKWTEICQQIRKTRTLTEIIVEAEDAISNPKKYRNYWKILQVCANYPKRPSPANNIFLEENFSLYKKKHPGSTQQQILKALHKKYQKLPDKEKALYVEKHQLAAKKYKREMRELSKKDKFPKKKRKRVSETSSDEGESSVGKDEDCPPKPPSSGYHLFCKEHMVSAEGIPGEKNMALAGQRWRVMTKEEKKEYNQRCSEIKTQYLAKLEEYLKNFSMMKQKQILKKLGIKTQICSEPKMPRRSAFTFFMQEKMGQMNRDRVAPRARQTKISEMWWKLSEQEKEPYRRKVEEDLSKYKLELQAWFEKLTPEQQEDYQKNNSKKCRFHRRLKKYVSDQEDSDEVSEQDDQSHRPTIPPCTGSSPLQPHKPSDSEDDSIDSSSEEDNDSEDNSEGEEQEEAWGDDISFEIF
ncbi:nucleolar transcription factor 1-like [Cheilinus undulatus]|uniref:nucleolar transcription factor 1-like n=1 Tax=Cheilinus undulatus TaxID=241271 RepID=UPI001BD4F999|nr:nucleolar transcription factor 1-like [Cheilinus undulatus]